MLKNRIMIRKIIVVILGLLGITDLSATIKVSGVFADNMVIQRELFKVSL